MKINTLHLSNNIWLAPMAGITNLPYRRIMKSFGAGLVFTEMISAKGLILSGKHTLGLLDSDSDERPLGIQLFGGDAETLAQAAMLVEEYGELIDINLGCPVNKVVRSGSGSALLRSPDKIGRIIAAVRRATRRPLTIKIRSGWCRQSINFLETARIAEAEGVDAITLHPRTRCQGFSGRADWEHLRQLKEAVKVPVIGSGDIFAPTDAMAMMRQTGCDGIMIGRGGYGNPWLIRDILALLEGREQPPAPDPTERHMVASHHLHLYIQTYGARKTLLDMRKHLCWYSRGLKDAALFRAMVNRAQSLTELEGIMTEFFYPAPALASP